MLYLWLKTLHIVFVASWFAGLFYLPRIFVNLAAETDAKVHARLLGMAQRLYRFMTIIAIPALVLGLWLWLWVQFFWGSGAWVHAKLTLVVVVCVYHWYCQVLLKQFAAGKNTKSHVWYRWFNEAPVLLMLAIVALVVIKPF